MDRKIRIVFYLYYFSLTGLLILYLFPGSLLGYFLYGDLDKQPDIIPNPMGTSINHALSFFYLTVIGLLSHQNQTSFKKNLVILVVLSFFLELSHLIIPNRSFQFLDLLANLLGTFLAIAIILLYKRFKYGKI
tara:strand:+ start:269 stop:667 length:399 start_codon:yes stop_codon:yes gene_type:complete